MDRIISLNRFISLKDFIECFPLLDVSTGWEIEALGHSHSQWRLKIKGGFDKVTLNLISVDTYNQSAVNVAHSIC